MSLLRLAARISSTCEHPDCGKQFEQPKAALESGRLDPYCSDGCAADAGYGICHACGNAFEPSRIRYQLPLCTDCFAIADRSCWQKRWFTNSHEALQWAHVYEATGGLRNNPYYCKLCPRWHHTSGGRMTVADGEFGEHLDAIAAVLRAVDFDIDTARGWTNNPDGTSCLATGDEHRNAEAAARVLRLARLEKGS